MQCAAAIVKYALCALGCAAVAATASAGDLDIRTYRTDDPALRIGPFAFKDGKTLNLTVGIGSSAFRRSNDPPNVIWTLGDRGPNIECKDMKAVAGVELSCGEVKNGRVYPTPSYSPSIYRMLLLDDGSFRVTDVITLKDRDGHPLDGLPLPLRTATTETPLDGAGAPLQQSLRGIDAEALERLSDGSFLGRRRERTFARAFFLPMAA